MKTIKFYLNKELLIRDESVIKLNKNFLGKARNKSNKQKSIINALILELSQVANDLIGYKDQTIYFLHENFRRMSWEKAVKNILILMLI